VAGPDKGMDVEQVNMKFLVINIYRQVGMMIDDDGYDE
jgi:hypothetical protein